MSYYNSQNTCTTATTNVNFLSSGNMASWYLPGKSCAGLSKCGKPCHKRANLTPLKKYRKNGRVVRVWCKECDEIFDVDMRDKCKK